VPALLQQLAPCMSRVPIYVSVELETLTVDLSVCAHGHVHVAIGARAPYLAVVVGLVRAVAFARLVENCADVDEADTLAEVVRMLDSQPALLSDLPPGLREALFALPTNSQLH